MSGTLGGLIGSFEAAAQAAENAEKSFRATLQRRLEALERQRIFAYRRMNLVIGIVQEAARQDARDTAVAAVIAFVAAEFRLERGRDRHETIIGQLASVAEAAALITHPSPEEDRAVPDLAAALATFEAWYQAETGAQFLARAYIALPETPLVDW